MNPFVTFMATPAGRAVRFIAGLALIAWGLLSIGGVAGAIIALVGVLPLVAGSFDFCAFAPLFKAPLKGSEVRNQL